MLQEAKHLKRQLLAIISNTISTTAILEINHFTCLKDIWNWQSDIINNEGPGFALALGSGSWGGLGTALSHKHNAQRVQSLQNIKIPPAILSCNIHVDTIERTMSSFESFHVQSGSERVRPRLGRGFHTSPGCCIPGKGDRFATLLPCVRGAEEDALS